MAGTRRDLTVVMNAILKMDGQQQIKELKRLVSSLEDDVNEYRSAWESALERVEDLERALSRVKNLSGMDVMERELQQFKDTAERSVREFENFLKVVNLNDFDFKRQKGVQELFDQIKRGTITSGQAIQEFKVRFQSLLEENYSKSGGVFDQAAVQNFTTTLEVMSSRLDTVAQKIAKIETEGVNVANGSGGGTGTVGNLAEQFDKIAMTAERMSDQAHNAVANVLELVQAINSYASADTANLLAVSRAFEGIANIGQGSFSEKSVNNLINLAKQISKLNENGNFKFSFNLEGLKDFKVSATIHHLSDFLAALTSDQVSNAERLSRVSLANFGQDSLKISKASFDRLIELINALANNPMHTSAISTAVDAAAQSADRAEKEYLEEAEAIHQVDDAYQHDMQVIEQRIRAEDLLTAIIARRRQAEVDAAHAEELYRKATQSTAMVPNTTGVLAAEQNQLQNLNRGYMEHVPSVRAAAGAEREKASASREVVEAINAEITEVDASTAAEERYAQSLLTAGQATAQSIMTVEQLRNVMVGMIQAERDGESAANRYAESMLLIVNACRQLGIAVNNTPLLTGEVGGQSENASGMSQYTDMILKSARVNEQHTKTAELLRRAVEGQFTAINEDTDAINRDTAATENMLTVKRRAATVNHEFENALLGEASAAKDAEASERQYHEALTQVANTLKNVQNAKHTLEKTPGGTSRGEYAELIALEQELQNLKNAGMSTPYDDLRDAIARLRNGMSDALQTMNLFTTAEKESAAAAKENASAADAVRSVVDRYEALGTKTNEVAQKMRDLTEAERVLAIRSLAQLNARRQWMRTERR